MRHFVLFIATLGLTCAAPSEDPNPVGIVGGKKIRIEKAPFQVALLFNGTQFCGGVLVGPKTVLTAAHCVSPSSIPEISLLNVRSASSLSNKGGLRVAVNQIVVHPNFTVCSESDCDYDIAVLHLGADAIVSGLPSAAIDMHDANRTFTAGTDATVTGWGTTSEGGSSSKKLRSVTLPVVSESKCREVYGAAISERIICAGTEKGGKDACQGDSGGPLSVEGKLAGLVSSGFGCARPNVPGTYTSVPAFRDWIRQTAGI